MCVPLWRTKGLGVFLSFERSPNPRGFWRFLELPILLSGSWELGRNVRLKMGFFGPHFFLFWVKIELAKRNRSTAIDRWI